MAARKLSWTERQALSATTRSKRPLTLAEHQQLGELLCTLQEMASDVYRLASCICTKRELQPLENLFTTGSGGPIERVRCLLDDKLFATEAQLKTHHPSLTSHDLGDVYYGVHRRLARTPSACQEVPDDTP